MQLGTGRNKRCKIKITNVSFVYVHEFLRNQHLFDYFSIFFNVFFFIFFLFFLVRVSFSLKMKYKSFVSFLKLLVLPVFHSIYLLLQLVSTLLKLVSNEIFLIELFDEITDLSWKHTRLRR